MKDKDKTRLAVRVFLCANKGKWFNARQLMEFVNENGFGGRSGITTTGLSRLLTRTWLQQMRIKRQRVNKKNVWEYCVVE